MGALFQTMMSTTANQNSYIANISQMITDTNADIVNAYSEPYGPLTYGYASSALQSAYISFLNTATAAWTTVKPSIQILVMGLPFWDVRDFINASGMSGLPSGTILCYHMYYWYDGGTPASNNNYQPFCVDYYNGNFAQGKTDWISWMDTYGQVSYCITNGIPFWFEALGCNPTNPNALQFLADVTAYCNARSIGWCASGNAHPFVFNSPTALNSYGITMFSSIPSNSNGNGTITQISGQSRRGTSTSNNINVTMPQTPTSGTALVAAIGTISSTNLAYRTVSSITETGVTWTKQANQTENGNDWGNAEIWFGVVGAGASVNITVNLSGTADIGAVADVRGYSGVATSSFLDKYATNSGVSTQTDTGTTATTTGSNDLYVGAVVAFTNANQTTPTNSFSLIDGAIYSSYSSLAYLEKIVNTTGTANSGTTIPGAWGWAGCIVAFTAAPSYSITVYSAYGAPTSNETLSSGSNCTAGVTSPWAGTTGTQYNCTSYSVDGGANQAGTSYLFSNIQANHTITFSWQTQYQITPSSDANSAITPSSAVWVNASSNQFFNYSANSGYLITNVLVDGSNATVTGNYTFSNVQAAHTIAVSSTFNGGGSGGGSGIVITVTPAPNIQPASLNLPNAAKSPAAFYFMATAILLLTVGTITASISNEKKKKKKKGSVQWKNSRKKGKSVHWKRY